MTSTPSGTPPPPPSPVSQGSTAASSAMAGRPSGPVPIPQPESDRYWEGLRRSEIWMRRCDDCHKAYFYPRDICPSCGSRRTQWFRSSGRGTIYTFAIVHRAPHPGFTDRVPYVAAIIDMEEGGRIPTNLVGVEPDPHKIQIGAKVVPVYEKLTDTITLLKFKPA